MAPLPSGNVLGHWPQAKLDSMLATGKLTAVQLAIIAAIAERNIRELGKAEKAPTPERTDAEVLMDELEAWAIANRPDLVELFDDTPGSGVRRPPRKPKRPPGNP